AVSILQVYAYLFIAWLWGVEAPAWGYVAVFPALALTGMMLGALGMLLSVAVLLLSQPRRSERRLLQGRLLSLVVALLAGSALYAHLGGHPTGIETLLAADAGSDRPGRMSIQTSVYLALLALTLIFGRVRKHALAPVVDLFNMALVMLALVVLAGYCFGASKLFGQSIYTRTSPQTLVCMVLLAAVAVGRRAEYGYFSVLIGVGIGSRIARTVLPFTLLLPFLLVIGGAYSAIEGWLSAPYAAAWTAAILSTVFFLLVLLMAWRINNLERDLREMSLTDELSGIYNRRGFNLLGEQALREARRHRTPLTVLFFDLDNLKQTNDRHGHHVGSQFVRDVAELLRTNFRGADIVARIGGDEFAVVTQTDPLSAGIAVARVDAAAAAMNHDGNRPYPISYSVGEASSEASGSESFVELVGRADTMMYAHKRAKKQARAA
ncbi:MAG: GGDEF domain-containing protein, partial [Nevskiales bacterium]